MKRHTIHCCFIAIISLLSALPIVAQQSSDTVYVTRFGAKPYSYTNCVKEVQNAIRACKERHAKVLVFEKGRYDFWPEDAERRDYFISNTSTEDECPSKMKTIGLLFEDMSGLTVEGNDATLMFHGKMTTIALSHCRAMRLHGLHVDFERPTASELTYTKADGKGVVVTAHRDTRYEIIDGKIQLYGEGWRSNIFHCIEYDPSSEHFFYSDGWKVLSSSKAEEVAPGVIRFNTPSNFHPQIGNTLTVRDIIRDQVGMFIYESSDITLESMKMHYMHGLGIISQYTHNITMKEVDCLPREGSGRLLASSADFMHFSGCSGKISILNCRYMGAHDDAINIHGTNLRAVEKVNTRTLTLRFMHGQSYGFDAYFKGDTVAFVHPSTLQRYAYACVKEVKRLSPRNVQLSFDRDIPSQLVLNSDCVENMTCTPEVEIRHCYFTRTSTRGTLVTTPRKVVIADNTYYKTGMSAILIEGDAEGWFESGPVRDVLIRNNSFIDCGYNGGPGNAIIALHPSNTVVDANLPVHRNVRIIGNTFRSFGNPLLYAKSTAGLVFTDNKVEADAGVDLSTKEMFIITGCKNCKIKK